MNILITPLRLHNQIHYRGGINFMHQWHVLDGSIPPGIIPVNTVVLCY